MRAQLTRGELFFIHYNASSRIGEPSAKYVVMFRLTKHLPVFDRMEFKWLSTRFRKDAPEKIEGLNDALYQLSEIIIDITQHRLNLIDNRYKIDDSSRYKITIFHPNPSLLSVMIKRYPQKHNMVRELKGFVDFKDKEFEWLLRNHMRLLFQDVTFNALNKDIRISKTHTVHSLLATDPFIAHIVVVWNKDGTPLRLTHPKWD